MKPTIPTDPVLEKKDSKPEKKEKPKTKSNVESYFDAHNRFIPKALADEILKAFNVITFRDTKEIAVYAGGVFKVIGGEDILKVEALRRLGPHFKSNRITETIEYIKLKTLIERDSINTEQLLINVRNGMYDVTLNTLRPHHPKYKSTIQLNVKYNSSALCPNILKFMQEVVSSEDMLVLLQYTGYSCIQDIKQQRALVIEGPMQNGKSTFIDLVCNMVGQENVAEQSIQSLNTDRFAKAQLNGRLINMFPDLPKKKLYDNSVFKMLTTDLWIDGEEKYVRKFRFKNTIHQIYSANQLPDVDDPDELAFFRRWIIITFPNSFSGKNADKNMLEKLTTETEISGLFNIAMIGLRELLSHDMFCYTQNVKDIQMRYLSKSNPVLAFVSNFVEYSDTDIIKQDLYIAFADWCKSQNITPTIANNIFGQKIKELHYESGRSSDDGRPMTWKNVSCTVPRPGYVMALDGTLTYQNKHTDSGNKSSCQGVRDIRGIVVSYARAYTRIEKEFVAPSPDTLTENINQDPKTFEQLDIPVMDTNTSPDKTNFGKFEGFKQTKIVGILNKYRKNTYPSNDMPHPSDAIEVKAMFVRELEVEAKISKGSAQRYVNDAFVAWKWPA